MGNEPVEEGVEHPPAPLEMGALYKRSGREGGKRRMALRVRRRECRGEVIEVLTAVRCPGSPLCGRRTRVLEEKIDAPGNGSLVATRRAQEPEK